MVFSKNHNIYPITHQVKSSPCVVKLILGAGVARYFLSQLTKSGKNIPADHKIYRMALNGEKYPKAQNKPKFSVPMPSKIGTFGMEINHLATLPGADDFLQGCNSVEYVA
jgi:hypothetical protein